MKKVLLLIIGLAGLAFASCGQQNCGCQNKDNQSFNCQTKGSCQEEKCSNKTEEHKCGPEKVYQSDASKTISNTSDILEKK